MPKQSNKGKSRSSRRPQRIATVGPSASNTIFKRMGDQVSRVVRNRYGGNMGISKLSQDVSLLMSIVNTEEKNIDQLTGLTTVTAAAPFNANITSPIQGSSGSTRTGDSILVNRIDITFKFNFSCGTAATTANMSQWFRWFLVRWLKTPSTAGSTPFANTDLLNVDSAGQLSVLSAPNSDLAEDFMVMETGLVELLLAQTTTVDSNIMKIVDVSKPCHFHQTFTGAASNTIVDNAMFIYIVAANANNAGGVSNVAMTTRMFYLDN